MSMILQTPKLSNNTQNDLGKLQDMENVLKQDESNFSFTTFLGTSKRIMDAYTVEMVKLKYTCSNKTFSLLQKQVDDLSSKFDRFQRERRGEDAKIIAFMDKTILFSSYLGSPESINDDFDECSLMHTFKNCTIL